MLKNKKILSNNSAIFFGAVLIAAIIPFLQWLDRSSLTNTAETMAPSPIAMTILLALIIITALSFLLLKLQIFSVRSLVIIYVMLTISVPFSSIGLVRPFFSSLTITAMQYLDWRTDTVLKSYNIQDPSYFPKLSDEGYKEFLELAKQESNLDNEFEDRRKRQYEILLPMKRYWYGLQTDPQEKLRYENPEWGLYEKVTNTLKVIPWKIWSSVLIRWLIFFALIFLGSICLTQIFFKDWVERENLSFPLAQVPLALLASVSGKSRTDKAGDGERSSSVITNPFFWSGAILGIILLLFGGMVHYKLININLEGAVTFQRIDFAVIFVNKPWLHIKENILFLTPIFMGIALLVRQDILRGAVWLFLGIMVLRMFVGMFELELTEMIGHTWTGKKLPYYVEMGTGAALVFAVFLLWQSRKAFGVRTSTMNQKENNYFPNSWAGIGLLICTIGIILWLVDLGISGLGGISLTFFILFWLYLGGIVLARTRTEAGLPISQANYVSNLIGQYTGGTSRYGLNNMTFFGHFSFLPLAAIPGLIATQIESLFISKKFNVSPRTILVSVIIALLIALSVGLLSFLVLAYWHGTKNLMHYAYEWHFLVPFWHLYSHGDIDFSHQPTQMVRLAMIIFGSIVMIIILFVRKRFPRTSIPPICFIIVCLGVYWKPEPIGIPDSWDPLYVNFIWGPMLIAYIIKSLILKFGGMDMYTRSLPLALGLILSQAIMIVFWNIYHAIVSPEGLTIFTGILTVTQ